jgi:serine/threonine protein kinase
MLAHKYTSINFVPCPKCITQFYCGGRCT